MTYWVFGMGTNELKNPLKTIKIEFIYRILIQTLKMEKGLKKICCMADQVQEDSWKVNSEKDSK